MVILTVAKSTMEEEYGETRSLILSVADPTRSLTVAFRKAKYSAEATSKASKLRTTTAGVEESPRSPVLSGRLLLLLLMLAW
jgi:hypothetical protein